MKNGRQVRGFSNFVNRRFPAEIRESFREVTRRLPSRPNGEQFREAWEKLYSKDMDMAAIAETCRMLAERYQDSRDIILDMIGNIFQEAPSDPFEAMYLQGLITGAFSAGGVKCESRSSTNGSLGYNRALATFLYGIGCLSVPIVREDLFRGQLMNAMSDCLSGDHKLVVVRDRYATLWDLARAVFPDEKAEESDLLGLENFVLGKLTRKLLSRLESINIRIVLDALTFDSQGILVPIS